jgi:hypothetical protein
MTKQVAAIGLAACWLVFATGNPATAGPTKAQKCTASKLKAACKKAACVLAVDLKSGTDKSKCTDGLEKTFSKDDDKGGCSNSGDAAAIEAKVDAFATDVASELKPVTNKCEAGKIKAVAKKVCCELGLDAKAEAKGGTADLTKCRSTFAATFTKLQAKTKGGCATSGDAATIETEVDNFVDDVFTQLK